MIHGHGKRHDTIRDNNLDIQIDEVLKAYLASGVEEQVDYRKFYLYSIVTHSTAVKEKKASL